MNESLVSIIIPAYNSEKTIEKCASSVLQQSYSNIEVIIVDDGSNDNTPNIIDHIASKNEKVTVIHNMNKGVSNARNTGIKNSHGEYICFLDADDQMSHYMIEILSQAAEKNGADIVCCKYTKEEKNLNKDVRRQYQEQLIDQQWLDKELLVPKHKVEAFVWNKIYNRKFVKKYNINFDERIKVCEDTLFNYQCNAHAEKRIYVPTELYFYNVNSNSTMFSADFNYGKLTANIAYDEMEKLCRQYHLDHKALNTAMTVFNLMLYKQILSKKNNVSKNDIESIRSRIYESHIDFLFSEVKIKYKLGYLAFMFKRGG